MSNRVWMIIIAIIATFGLILGMSRSPLDYFSSYLIAIFFFLSISLGALGNLMIYRLTGGNWGSALQPALIPLIRTMPLLALLFVPILFGIRQLYPWAIENGNPASWWLGVVAFKTRAAIYLVIWTGLSLYFGSHRSANRTTGASAAGIIVYGISVSFAAIDWIMSLMPQWYSTVFGLLIGTAQLLAGLSVAVIIYLKNFDGVAIDKDSDHRPQLLNDFGNLLLTYLLTWMYLAYIQYLIIWAADLPREIAWYMPRLNSSWRWLMLSIVLMQFFFPFGLLLSRTLKRQSRWLLRIAMICVVGQWLYVFQLIMPSVYVHGFHFGGSVLLATFTVGLWWLLGLRHQLRTVVAYGEAAHG